MTRELQRVLSYCNRARAQLGFLPLIDLERGAKESVHECPIARSMVPPVESFALDLTPYVYGEELYVLRGGDSECDVAFDDPDPPAYIREFIKRFDAGKLPDLVA